MVYGKALAEEVQEKDNVHRCTPSIPSIGLQLESPTQRGFTGKVFPLSFTAPGPKHHHDPQQQQQHFYPPFLET